MFDIANRKVSKPKITKVNRALFRKSYIEMFAEVDRSINTKDTIHLNTKDSILLDEIYVFFGEVKYKSYYTNRTSAYHFMYRVMPSKINPDSFLYRKEYDQFIYLKE